MAKAPARKSTASAKENFSNKNSAAPLIGYVTPHVHWDRAWYLPFQQYRYRLIEFVDELLALLEDPDSNYPSFEFDGQTVVLEDYLEIKPENRQRIEKLVKDGKLGVGPWYVLPDEFIVGGEALVRNLQFGYRISEEFGGRCNIGYVPDPFGHVGQLPAILQGVGLDTFLFTRGAGQWVGEAGCVFDWIAADGKTSVLAVKQTPDYPCLMAWGFEIRQLDRKSSPDVNVESAMGRLQRLLDGLENTYNWTAPVVQLGNGSDHTAPQPTLPMLIEKANEHFKGKINLQHARFSDFFDAIKEWKSQRIADGNPLVEFQGELHQGWDRALLSGVYSARLYLKRMNDATMNVLYDRVEPLAALAWNMGGRPRPDALQLAWREVLRNHPHDDICGCSVDATHQDMEIRYRHAREISTMLVEDLREDIQPLFDLHHENPDAVPFLLHNPRPTNWSGTLNLNLVVPKTGGWLERDFAFAVLADGDGLLNATAEITAPSWGLHIHPDRVANVQLPRVKGSIEVSGLEPGWHVAHLLPGLEFPLPPGDAVRCSEGDDSASRWMENSLIRVVFRDDGRWDIIDLSTGRTFVGLGQLEDDEEAGDSYDHSPGGYPVAVGAGKDVGLDERPEPVDRRNTHTVEDSDIIVNLDWSVTNQWSATMHIQIEWSLPTYFEDETQKRSAQQEWVSIEHWVTMRSASPVLEIETIIDNSVEDHRTRIIVPTGVNSKTVTAGGAFEMVERPWFFPHVKEWNQPEVPTKHMHNLVLAEDEEGGLAAFAPGSNEYEAREGEDGGLDLCLTLVRSVGWLSRDGFAWRRNRAGPCFPAPGAQCNGQNMMRWGLMPFEGKWSNSQLTANGDAVHEIAASFASRPTIIAGLPKPQLDASFDPLPNSGKLGTRHQSWILEGAKPKPILVSCKPCENGEGYAMRFFNPTATNWHGSLEDSNGLSTFCSDMLERVTEECKKGDITIPAGGIATYVMR
ncbi:MAG: hypothetical protein HOE92_04715 [Euryarchaeota archaeon]|jgi:mannosylglycerate hydrolase|nr:hypothetical protein [Euryarchaeota archaeon]MBT6644522.1 hypothetical protein [Euryarchaeota archaeon]